MRAADRYPRHSGGMMCALHVLLLSFVCMYKANATSIREVTLEELLMRSELVFEGTVTNLRARQSHDGIIRTSITFTVAETITGKHPGRTLTLEFLGGTAGSRSTVISGMRLPEPGEHGIYFVEAVGRKQVNPFYGWSQGHFIVEKDPEGTERVMTNRGKPVIGIRDNPPATPAAAISRGVARGIVAAEGRASGPALSVQEFKASLRALISRQREANQLDKQP